MLMLNLIHTHVSAFKMNDDDTKKVGNIRGMCVWVCNVNDDKKLIL